MRGNPLGGGGVTLVPILAALFSAQALSPEHNLHLALGTAMASVMFTASANTSATAQSTGRS